jgi:hypothetical protein
VRGGRFAVDLHACVTVEDSAAVWADITATNIVAGNGPSPQNTAI